MKNSKTHTLTADIAKKREPNYRVLFVKFAIAFVACMLLFSFLYTKAAAAGITVDFDTEGSEGGMSELQLLFMFALLSLAPSILIMMTSFTRIVIVFSFLRNAIGLQQTPPNQVIVGISLFLSYFIMMPVINQINTESVQPYMQQEITQEVALEKMQEPIKEFMLKQTKAPDLNLFLSLSGDTEKLNTVEPDKLMSLGLEVIVPAFITSELKRAFTIGFLLFLPFLIIDMIVSSTLMSMGMVMLPPSTIALPFKLMLFVVVDGWSLIMEMLVKSFY
ncbi:flagellar type III secretion system pore protein FliP [Scatolibacter rhodanostii]|uniref:flagellar type III secretion system pore protein FliP n=1 Tax=Scatolibacter rhodanostii TaxID=2014781 RepID=UPI001FA8A61B|nr:flagellar type III secretion system pore protein FliP [Scatolibacter rhodanostii]